MTTRTTTADDPRRQAARALLDTLGDALTDGCGFLQQTVLSEYPPEQARLALYHALVDTAGRFGRSVIQAYPALAPVVRAAADNLVMYLAPTKRPQ